MTKRQSRTRLALPLLALPLLVLALGSGAWVASGSANPKAPGAPAPKGLLPVEVLPVVKVEGYELERTYTGTLHARRTVQLSFEVPGRVAEILAWEGSHVQKGDHLARLDVRRLEAQRAGLEAQRAELAATLAEMEAGPREQTIRAAAAEVEALAADRELAGLQTERRRGLVERDSLSAEELDRFAAQERVLAARRDAAAARLDELREGTREEQLDAQRARLAGLDASLKSLAIDIEDSLLEAPFTGYISQRFLEEGTVVGVGTAVVELMECDVLEAWIGLPVDAARLGEQSETELIVDGREVKQFEMRQLPMLDEGTRTMTAILELTSEDSVLLYPGQIARLTLRRFVERPGFWLPLSALTEGRRGLWSCFVLEEDDRLARADLEVLHVEGERALVRGTLRGGDQVVLHGTHRVTAGQQVEPLQQEEE